MYVFIYIGDTFKYTISNLYTYIPHAITHLPLQQSNSSGHHRETYERENNY